MELSGIDALISILIADFGIDKSNVLSANQVGAIVGGELSSTGITLLGLTMAIILAYISFRFQFKFALGAIVALTHDLILTVAFIGFFQIKPSVPIIAALLTLLGYSINDTIVVFDRIRENASGNLDQTFGQTINSAINQTLGRTFNTSFATLISIVAIIIGERPNFSTSLMCSPSGSSSERILPFLSRPLSWISTTILCERFEADDPSPGKISGGIA